jgi:polysaccharide export outer membrane protein
MGTKGRRAGLVAAATLSLCLGLCGCVATESDYRPLEAPAYACPGCARMGGSASRIDPVQDPLAAPETAQTSYRPLDALQNATTALGPIPVDSSTPGQSCCPRELTPVSHPPYTVAPPDVLLIDALRMVPRGPYRLEPLEVLQIAVTDTLPGQPIAGSFMISPEGTVNLGYKYGAVRVGGLTLDEAEVALRKHLGDILKSPSVSLAVVQFRGIQQVHGEHLVRPDGTISLGTYGTVYVAGLTLGQVKWVVEKHLSDYLVNPQLSVDVISYNSKKYYVIFDGGGYGQQVFALPVTGNETVLDAISRVGGLAPVSSTKKIMLARPSPVHLGCNQILPVDWKAVELGSTATNYQIFPGDRIYVYADPLIAFDNHLAKLLAPVERIFGITLLGTTTVQSFRNNGTAGTGFFVTGTR